MNRFEWNFSRKGAWLVLLCLVLSGCGQESVEVAVDIPAIGPGVSNASLVMTEMPDGVVSTPTEIMEMGVPAANAIVAGRIDAGDVDPFQPGEMAFMISQLPEEGHGEDDPDHADNCPFCKRKLANAPKAIIQFRGADGNVLPGDASQALTLQKGDIVYVTGTAEFNAAVNTVMVDASGVFRQSAP